MKPRTQITLNYVNGRGLPGRLVLIQENLHTFIDRTGRVFGTIHTAMAAHRTGNRITGREKTVIMTA